MSLRELAWYLGRIRTKIKSDRIALHAVTAFGLALVVYLVAFYLIEHRRTQKGGWRVTFRSDAAGVPDLIVAQPQLGISNVAFAFPGQRVTMTNLAQTIVFDQPTTNVPFGQVIYLDTTFLPGSIVFHLFGHEIQLLPRVLLVDQREIPWQDARRLELPDLPGTVSPGAGRAQLPRR